MFFSQWNKELPPNDVLDNLRTLGNPFTSSFRSANAGLNLINLRDFH